MDQFRPIVFGTLASVTRYGHGVIVAPKVVGEVIMTDALAVVTVKYIDGLLHGIPLGARIAKSPFSKSTGNIARSFHYFKNSFHRVRQRVLPFRLDLIIAPDGRMSCV